jgi:class 3 adenylate cyclase/tetratricopeptide (TPR) repeat protein
VLYAARTVTCPSCGTANPADTRFCLECGTALGGCPSCGTVNPPTAKFCGNCGTRLAPAAVTPQPGGPLAGQPGAAQPGATQLGAAPATPWDAATTTERRMVSVLFADLVGFTALSSTRDPETVREIQDRYFERTSEIIGRYGGTVEKFIGDAVMAMWGAPVAHEDDAERAVRAALDLVDMVPTLGRESDVELQLRAGVLTGEAAVGLGAEGQGMVTGDMVNTASRLQSVAAPGTVLVGADTRLAAESAIGFEPAGDQVLKGKEAPVPSWRAVRVLAERGGARRPDALEPPFVGRAEELRFLKEQFHATGREQRARLISLVGQAGIGKTRLAWELEKYLDGVVETVYWHRGRAPSYGEGVTFWALSEMIRSRAGLTEGDDPETTRSAVAAMVAQHVPDATERAWIAPRLNALLGVGEPVTGGHEELFAAWRTFFERLASAGTVALVIEDLQWSDDGLLDFLEHLLDWARTSPIFVLTLARPELLERRPGWGTDRRGAISMRLEPLTDDAIRELLDGLVPGLPDAVVRRVVERADGIPLYAVETVRMLLASGSLVEREGHLAAAGPINDLEVPPTLHALVAARLDGLPPADRSLLQDAAVLGQSFSTEALSAMTGESAEELAPRLASLVRREVFTIETDPRAPTRGQHAFVQGLVREVAYSTLSRRERRARHLTAARYFETLVDEELAGAVATHFVAAYRAAPDGPEGEAIGNQARIALVATADRAERLGALTQAMDALRQAADVSREPTERARILERLGWVATEASRVDQGAAALDEAIELFEDAGDRVGVIRATAWLTLAYQSASRIAEAEERAAVVESEGEALVIAVVEVGPTTDRARGEAAAIFAEALGRLRFRQQRFDDSIAWCDRALRVAGPLRLDAVIGQALTTKGTALGVGGRLREGAALLQGALLDARSHGQNQAALRAVNNLASFLTSTDPRAALERVREGIELARRMGDRATSGYLVGNAVGASLQTGDWDLAIGWAAEMLEGAPDQGNAIWLRFCQDLAGPWRGTADLPAAQALLEEARRVRDAQTEANVLSFLADVAWAAGHIEEAADLTAQHLVLDLPAFAYDRSGVALLEAGRVDEVRRLLRELEGSDGSSALQRGALEASLLAVEGARQEAVPLFRSSVAGLRELGCRFSAALVIFDMLTFLGPEEPAVRSVLPDGREILADLEATVVLERFDQLAGATGADGRPTAPAPTVESETATRSS